jgi:hypothetical protein
MFQLRLTTKRELMLWAAQLAERDERIRLLEMELRELRESVDKKVERERRRAEGAINILLAKTQGAVIKDERPSAEELDGLNEAAMGIFGRDDGEEGDRVTSAREIEELQRP